MFKKNTDGFFKLSCIISHQTCDDVTLITWPPQCRPNLVNKRADLPYAERVASACVFQIYGSEAIDLHLTVLPLN